MAVLKAKGTARVRDRMPTSSIGQVLLTGATGLLLALLLNAQAVVHASAGMTDGPLRAVTLAVGETALEDARATHLTWPRDRLDALLGQQRQPAAAPLLTDAAPPATSVSPAPSATQSAGAAPLVVHDALAASPARAPSQRCACPTAVPTAAAVATAQSVTSRAAVTTAGPPPTSLPSTSPAQHELPRSAPPTPTPRPATTTAQPSDSATAIPHAPASGPPPRQVTAASPLRLLVTGDSLTGYLGPELVDEAAAAGPVTGVVETHDGTGLTSPAFVDWSVVAREQVAKDHPDAVVVMIGGNDFQNMTLPGGHFFLAGSATWTQEYQRRAEVCMEIWAQGGRARVYWLSMPPARNPQWAKDDAQINVALQRAAAQVSGVKYLDVLGPITDHGKYADFVTNTAGQPVLIREQDGLHLNIAGSIIVAKEVLPVIERDWHVLPSRAAGASG